MVKETLIKTYSSIRTYLDINTKLLITLLLILFSIANAVMFIKYAMRYNIASIEALLGLACLYIIVYNGGIVFFHRLPRFCHTKSFCRLLVLMTLIISALLLWIVKLEWNLNDRYFMIQVFWENIFQGINPYHPRLNSFFSNIPGAFPWYFVIAFPFWMSGEIGLLAVASFLLYVWCLTSVFRGRYSHIACGIMVVLGAGSFWYEIPARSTLFMNLTIVLFYIIILEGIEDWKSANIILAGIIGGVVLSTRTIVIMPLLAYYLFALRNNKISLKNLLLIFCINTCIYAAPILFLMAKYTADFKSYNPFMVQLAYADLYMWSVILVCSYLVAEVSRSIPQFFTYIGAAILFLALGQNLWSISRFGLIECLSNNRMDISYMVMALPFIGIGIPYLIGLYSPEKE